METGLVNGANWRDLKIHGEVRLTSRSVSVLVAEGHQHMRAIYRSLLRPLMHADEIFEARDGVQALELLRSHSIDIAVVELGLPDLSGLELIQLIRRAPDSPWPYLPILAVSADATTRSIESARDAGANGFLAKPFTAKALQSSLDRLMRDQRPFVRTPTYVGPDRRRRSNVFYDGPRRRASDRAACGNTVHGPAY